MATFNVSSVNEVISLMSSANPGDTIILAAGNYSGTITKSNVTKASPYVTIKGANTSFGTRFTGQGINWTNVSGFILDNLWFGQNSLADAGFPDGSNCVFNGGGNITVQNCKITGGKYGLNFKNNPSNITIQRNEFSGGGQDDIRFLQGVNGLYRGYNWHHDPNIDPARQSVSTRHSDTCQFAIIAGWGPAKNSTEEFNYIDLWSGYKQAIFYNAEDLNVNNFDTDAHQNVTIFNNFIRSGWPNGIFLNGTKNADINRNVLRKFPGGSTPLIRLGGGKKVTGQCRNNVSVAAIENNANDQTTKSNNTISDTAFPSGWVNLVPGQNVGPNTGGVVPPPATPATLTSAALDGGVTALYDAGQLDFNGTVQQCWGGVITIPPTSDAFKSVPSDAIIEWLGVHAYTGVALVNWRPTIVDPQQPTDANGNKRYRMQTIAGDPIPQHVRPSGGLVISSVSLRWRPADQASPLFSAPSTYTTSSPATPVAATPPVVNSAALNAANYTVGQTATVNFAFTQGSGGGLSRTVEWLLDGVVFSTQHPSTNSASTPVNSAGQVTARVTISTTAGTSTLTSAASTVAVTPVAPVVTAVTLDKPSYTTGDVAVATVLVQPGNGTFVSESYEWFLDGSPIGTNSSNSPVLSAGAVTCKYTYTTSVSAANRTSAASPVNTPAPATPTNWQFVGGAVSAPNFTNLFTAIIHWQPGTNVVENDLTAVQWRAVGGDGIARPTSNAGLDPTARRKWRLEPSPSIANDTAHTVGYDQTSLPIQIRISTVNGTSDWTQGTLPADANNGPFTFTGPPAPPPDPDPQPTAPPAPLPADWSATAVLPVPNRKGRFTVRFFFEDDGAIDQDDLTGVEWLRSDNVWRPAVIVGVSAGRNLYELRGSSIDDEPIYSIPYDGDSDLIFIRITTVGGTSVQSTTGITFSSPAAPAAPTLSPGDSVATGGNAYTLGGKPYSVQPTLRPGSITDGVTAVLVDDEVVFNLVGNPPPEATHLIFNYAGRSTVVPAVKDAVIRVPYVEGVTFWTVKAGWDSSTATSRARFGHVKVPD